MSNYYTVIPAQVRTDKRLLPLDKLIYGEVFVLAKQTGFCWAQNSFFAAIYEVRPETVSRSLKKLESAGYIKIEFEGRGNSGRKILPLDMEINTLDLQIKGSDAEVNPPLTCASNTLDLQIKGSDAEVKPPLTCTSNTLDPQIKQNIKRKKQGEYKCAFAQFWEAYPKKRDKARARKAFDKLAPDQTLLDQILSALAWQTKSQDWTKANGQYIPLASTYLNGRRWEDEPSANTTAARPSVPKLKTVVDEKGNEVCVYENR